MRSIRTAALSASLSVVFALATQAAPVAAQAFYLTVPFGSQRASVTQTIGLTDISVTYDRPGVDGRKIWGELEPYDSVWRAGANVNLADRNGQSPLQLTRQRRYQAMIAILEQAGAK